MYSTTYELQSGKVVPVSGYVERANGESVPLLDIPMMSDLKWHQECLRSRLEHREQYARIEDVDATILHLAKMIDELQKKGKEIA